MQNKDPDIIAKNECIGALFAPLTGQDPFLNDAMRSAIDYALSGDGGSPASLEAFMHKAVELSVNSGRGGSVSMYHLNLRGRSYEPLWMRGELISGLKPLTGESRSLLIVSGLREAVRNTLPRRQKSRREADVMEEARQYIDALAARFTASSSHLTILYQDSE
ncbi:MAG: hypothetical protein JW942_01735 [Opitutales bacterium]|nr:hypothetical protein [Opitutales bacterium]